VSGSPLRRLLVHVSHYSLASLLTTIAGLISFPFLTRVFSVAEYGTMSLISATLTIAVALGKIGIQFPLFPYHSEIASGKRAFTLDQLYSTTMFGMGATGLATGLILGSLVAFSRGDRVWRVLLGLAWRGSPCLGNRVSRLR
jgi:O-antigen/teichoic acid export membrane protein